MNNGLPPYGKILATYDAISDRCIEYLCSAYPDMKIAFVVDEEEYQRVVFYFSNGRRFPDTCFVANAFDTVRECYIELTYIYASSEGFKLLKSLKENDCLSSNCVLKEEEDGLLTINFVEQR